MKRVLNMTANLNLGDDNHHEHHAEVVMMMHMTLLFMMTKKRFRTIMARIGSGSGTATRGGSSQSMGVGNCR